MTTALALAQITPFVTEQPSAFEVAAGYVAVLGGAALCVGLAFVREARAERAGGRSVGAMLAGAFGPALIGLAFCGAVFAVTMLVSGRLGGGEVGSGIAAVVLMGALYVPVAWALAVAASVTARTLTPKAARAEAR